MPRSAGFIMPMKPVRPLLLLLLGLSCSARKAQEKLDPAPAIEASASQKLPPQAAPAYEVKAVEEMLLHDEKRKKDLPLTVRYPKGEGPFPVIVFSHGAGGSGKDYLSLVEHWVRSGYVCLQPTHGDSRDLRGERDEEGGFLEWIRREIEDPAALENRAKDVSFAIDSIAAVEDRVPDLRGKIDRARIGVGGHSFGALTSQAIAGARFAGKTFADERPKAILLLSGQGRGRAGLADGSWEGCKRPMMVMSGSRDRGMEGEEPRWRMEPFEFAPPGDKHSVWIEGATHMSFTGRLAQEEKPRGLRGRILERQAKGTDQKAVFEEVKKATLVFWNAYLKEDSGARTVLQSGELERKGGGIVKANAK